MDELLTFRGNIINQRYESETDEGTYRIVGVCPEEPGPEVVVKGMIQDWDSSLVFEFTGKFVEDKKYGSTFVATGATRLRPVDLVGIEKFLARWIDGVGPTKAKAMVRHFEEGIFDVLDSHPERLTECPGVSVNLVEKIKVSWKDESDPILMALRIWLAKLGMSSGQADRFYKAFGDKAQKVLEENPYRSMQISGVGFRRADELAERMGWPECCPERTEAAVGYVAEEQFSDGHCFIREEHLVNAVRRVASSRKIVKDEKKWLPAEDAKTAIERVSMPVADHKKDKRHRKPLVVVPVVTGAASENVYYKPEVYEAECRLALRIGELQSFVHITPRGIEDTLSRVLEGTAITLTAEQQDAVISALTNNLSVTTGGPGTGKTTALNTLLRTAVRVGLRVMLCAPTGRAAKRLSEVTEREAQTIHKMLRFDPVTEEFGFNRRHTLPCDLLVVDETSMLDVQLADSLLDAVSDACSVVFVGDADQLPSVGPGMVLRDIIISEKVHVTRLETIFRQAAGSLIIQNAHKIRVGQMPSFPDVKKGRDIEADSYFIEVPKTIGEDGKPVDDLQWVKNILPKVMQRIVAKHGVNPIQDIQILMPMRKGVAGFPEFNKVVQPALNPHGREVAIKGQKFRIGDRVMQLSNNYDLEIYNGDIGFIQEFDEINHEIEIDFDGRIVRYPYGETDDLVLSYAVTIHKSQGSEFDFVIVIMTGQHYMMLERHLLYTANTRAKRMIVFIASLQALKRAVSQDKVNRNTALALRIRKATADAALLKAA